MLKRNVLILLSSIVFTLAFGNKVFIDKDSIPAVNSEITTRYSVITDDIDGAFTFVVIDEIDGNISSISVVETSNCTNTTAGLGFSGSAIITTDIVDPSLPVRVVVLLEGVTTFVVIDDVDGN
jgi:hypothetical protein